MDVRTKIDLLYLDGTISSHTNATVLEIFTDISKLDFGTNPPLAILRPGIGLHLLYDPYRLGMYKIGETPFDEVLEYLGCDGLYRNNDLLKDDRGNEADPGSLWKLRNGKLYLVDDDAHLTCNFADVQQLFNKIA